MAHEGKPIKLLIVEDEGLFRELLHSKLADFPQIEVVGEASTGREAIQMAELLSPKVILMDIDLGGALNGIVSAQIIRASAPDTGIVLLSIHSDKQFVATTMEEHPVGWSYLLKKNVRDVDTLVRAIEGVTWGKVVVDPQLITELTPRSNTQLNRLSEEQLQTIELMAQGYSDAAIVSKQQISDPPTLLQDRLEGIYKVLDIEQNGQIDPRVKAVLTYLEQTRMQ